MKGAVTKDDTAQIVEQPSRYSPANQPPHLSDLWPEKPNEEQAAQRQKENNLVIWDRSGPRRPLYMQAAGEILGPARCRDWEKEIPYSVWYDDDTRKRLNDWCASFVMGDVRPSIAQTIPRYQRRSSTGWGR